MSIMSDEKSRRGSRSLETRLTEAWGAATSGTGAGGAGICPIAPPSGHKACHQGTHDIRDRGGGGTNG